MKRKTRSYCNGNMVEWTQSLSVWKVSRLGSPLLTQYTRMKRRTKAKCRQLISILCLPTKKAHESGNSIFQRYQSTRDLNGFRKTRGFCVACASIDRVKMTAVITSLFGQSRNVRTKWMSATHNISIVDRGQLAWMWPIESGSMNNFKINTRLFESDRMRVRADDQLIWIWLWPLKLAYSLSLIHILNPVRRISKWFLCFSSSRQSRPKKTENWLGVSCVFQFIAMYLCANDKQQFGGVCGNHNHEATKGKNWKKITKKISK